MSGPTTWTLGGQPRGYSSWGNVPTIASSRLMPAVEMLERLAGPGGARAVQF